MIFHHKLSDREKLTVILPHLLKHNDEHAHDIVSLAAKATAQGEHEVARELTSIVALSEHISAHLRAALEKLGTE
jgi:hypothetical protein